MLKFAVRRNISKKENFLMRGETLSFAMRYYCLNMGALENRTQETLMKIAALSPFAATLATASLAAGDRSFYVGLVGGYARPEEMLEEWAWKSKGQSADLKENLKGGYLIGLKAGYLPAVCKRI
ncbi:MAG: hypothetical protein RBS22_12060, partial [Spongiibacteraceae bacterium]|nr:hypothetical protein [Spongiibacteraceae bacterium]